MAFNITLYNFSKQENSTKRPDNDGTRFDCVLKESSSVINPVIKFAFSMATNVSQYNYASIPLFERYYYVDEWTYSDGLWVASFKVDVLATWKDVIGDSTLYVLRSASQSNGDLVDNMYPCLSNVEIVRSTFDNIWTDNINDGCYVVGIINSEVGGIGATTYYTLNRVQMKTLNSYLLGDVAWLDITETEIIEAVQKIIFNPYQYLISCYWFPFPPLETNITSLTYGWWTLPSTGALMSEFVYINTFTMNIPKHSQIHDRGDFLQSEPYSQYYMSFYPFGMFKIDSIDLYNNDYVTIRISVDMITGVGRLVVSCNDKVVTSVLAQVGIPIQLSQVTTDYIGMAQSIIGGAQSIATGYMVSGGLGAIVGGVSAIGNIAETIAPKVQSTGSGGGFSSLLQAFTDNKISLYGRFLPVANEDNVHRGRPLCELTQISNLSGYILVADADVSINGTSVENSQITSILQGGFYYE